MIRFEDLITTHHDEIYRYVYRLLYAAGSAADAEDVTQEVFERAYRAYGRLPQDSNVRAWLYKIATNCCNTALKRLSRHYRRTADLDAMPPDHSSSPEQHLVFGEALNSIRAAISELPSKQRSALIMRYLVELPYNEIAEALGCSQDSARANVHQALKRLRHVIAME